jgi:translocation and assembly module TamB
MSTGSDLPAPPRRRRKRWLLAAAVLAVGALAATAVWLERDLWRESAAHYLRERLARDYGAEFETAELRGRWFPPALSLGRVRLHRAGEPWVLTVDDVSVSFNLYAMLFRKEWVGKVRLRHPHLIYRVPDAAAGAASLPAAGTAETGLPLGDFFRPPLPFRSLEVQEGRVEVRDAAGRRYAGEGIELSVQVGRGKGIGKLAVARGVVELPGRRVEIGPTRAAFQLEAQRVTVQELETGGDFFSARLHGTVAKGGGVDLAGEVSLTVDRALALLAPVVPLGGKARFAGTASGQWDEPRVEGTLSLRDPVVRGVRWPSCEGKVSWRGGLLSWQELRVPVGEGELLSRGTLDLGPDPPRYEAEVSARAVDLARLPGGEEGPLGRARVAAGSLRWEGAGFAAAGRTGRGSLQARLAVEGWPDEIEAGAEAQLAGEELTLSAFTATAGPVSLRGAGAWTPAAGFAGRVAGTAGGFGRLVPAAGGALDGDAAFDGAVAAGEGGPRFTGTVRVERGRLGRLEPVSALLTVEVTPAAARVARGELRWPGGSGTASGTLELPSRRLSFTAALEQAALAEVAGLLRVEQGGAAGALGAKLALTGTLEEPVLAGEVTGRDLRYRTVGADAATLRFTYADRRLEVPGLTVTRGATRLVFHGEIDEDETVEADFESALFEVKDLLPAAGLDVAGALRGHVSGTLGAPVVAGRVNATRFRYGGWDFKGGVIDVDYRADKIALTGWLVEEANRFRAVLEPTFDWRFEVDLELKHFSAELLRPGIGSLPPALGRSLEKASFLAAGRLQARGRLGDLAELRGGLTLDTLWIQGAGKSLQNVGPVQVSWRDRELQVGSFRLVGDQYHVEVSGKAGPATGWDIEAGGAVNLALFSQYWSELQELDGLCDAQFRITGPWLTPLAEGSIVLKGGYLKARSLPEPLENLEGRLTLRGRTLVATDISGSIAGGTFTGAGSYAFDEDRLAAEVRGRLDLALFRGRIPAARDLRGPVEVRLGMNGPIAAPAFSGEVDVLDAELFVRPFPAKITRLKGHLEIAADRIEIRDLAGQVGGGTVKLGGKMNWAGGPTRVDFDLDGRDILISLAGAVKAQADLQLGLHGDFTALKLAGEVRLLKGRYLLEFDEAPPSFRPTGVATASGGPDLDKLLLDIRVRATDNVWISNKMAKIEASLALDLGGTLGKPVVKGEILGIQGEAYYLSRHFRLESGSLRFVPPSLMPQLDLQASTTVGDTQILFLMDGPLDKLAFHLSSLPAKSQEDLIAILTIGETRADIEKRGDRASAVGAAVFTSEPVVNALGDEARTAMGLEILQVEPVVGDANQVSARVTVGTHLSDRLFVSYSQNLGATEDQQVKVEYHILDYLSVWGQELRQGVYSLDLVFKYAFP